MGHHRREDRNPHGPVTETRYGCFAVADRPISVRDFMATVCKVLGINYDKTITTPAGRPVRIVDKGEKVLAELF